jgi:hypothetical protein
MIYIINRASDHYIKKESPCEEAIEKAFENWDTRLCTEESYNNRFALKHGTWRSKGKNHTLTEDGYITRQMEDNLLYIIDINTLEDLHRLIDKYGTLIIDNGDSRNKTPTITIYDYYME